MTLEERLAEIRADEENDKEIWHLGCVCCERMPRMLELVDQLMLKNLDEIVPSLVAKNIEIERLQEQVREAKLNPKLVEGSN